jgi:hypothetical protein
MHVEIRLTAVAALALLAAASVTAQILPSGERRYPPTPSVVDVTQPPYNAKGDGSTDDTQALQLAINENTGRHRLLYLPNGTYLVSRTLTWPKNWKGTENWGRTFLCGQSRDGCTIRLQDATFTDPTKPQAIMRCGGFGSADWFHNYVENLTFDVGRGNPGAIALQFYSNNSGAVRDCRFVARDNGGAVGLDLAHSNLNGPLLVRNCEVVGFGRGITTAGAVNSQTFEHITLRGQREVGLQNEGQAVSIRGLRSDNAVPAVSSYGTLVLLEAKLTGRAAANRAPAIVNYNGGHVLLRAVTTSAYGRALADLSTPDLAAAFRIQGEDRPGSLGPDIVEYCSQTPTSPFPAATYSLRLLVPETPEIPWDDPRTWANVDRYGADPTGQTDSAAAIQSALDSGATTVFLPGSYLLRATITLRGKVRRLVGVGGMINYGKGLHPDLRLDDGDAPLVAIEHFAHIAGGLELNSHRTVLLRSVSDCTLTSTPASSGGQLFLEDVCTSGLALRGQRLWARQLNIENEGTHLANDAGDLWVLGYKTERGGTLLETRGGGRSEILGGFSYTTTTGALAPMLVNDASAVYAFLAEVCNNGDPFTVLVKETRHTETRTVGKGQGHTRPYSGHPE